MKRHGVTLLEVLFAIAIAAIGILGVLGTLVVAGKQAADGARLDGADRLGRNAIREFEVRAMNRPHGARGTWSLPYTSPAPPHLDATPQSGYSYCLDPLYVAANGTASPASWFPAIDPIAVPGPRMRRASLRVLPGDQMFSPAPPIGRTLAESIFVAKDDLVFSLPGDRTSPPQQVFDRTPSPNSVALSRSYEGKFSWFATVQLRNNRYVPAPGLPPPLDYTLGESLLSVVVCHRRDVDDLDAERLVNVEQIDGNQFKLAARSGQPDSDLDSREAGWLLLIGNMGGVIEFRWHRIQNVKDSVAAGDADYDGTVSSVATRWVSTFGRDWPHAASNTQVCLIDSVVAVYEKTVQMEE